MSMKNTLHPSGYQMYKITNNYIVFSAW
jgi:hypothetical protein